MKEKGEKREKFGVLFRKVSREQQERKREKKENEGKMGEGLRVQPVGLFFSSLFFLCISSIILISKVDIHIVTMVLAIVH